MKKYLSSLLVMSLVVLSACQGGSQGANNTTQENGIPQAAVVPPDPFKGDGVVDEKTALYFLDNDSLEDVAVTTPYYAGAQPSLLPAYVKFDGLRKTKVQEAIRLTGEVFDSAKQLRDAMRPLKDAHLQLMAKVLEQDKTLGNYAKGYLEQVSFYDVKEKLLELAIDSAVVDSTNARTASTSEYFRSNQQLDYGATVYEDFLVFMANSAKLSRALEASTDPTVKSAADEFDKAMEGVGSVDAPIRSILKNRLLAEVALRQLETADYYMTMAGLEYAGEILPSIKAQVESLKPSEDLEQEDIDLMKEYVAQYESAIKNFSTQLEKIDVEKSLLALPVPGKVTGWIPYALAGVGDTLSWAYNSVVDTADQYATKIENAASSAASSVASGVSYGYQAVKGGVNTAVDFGVSTAQSASRSIASAYNAVSTSAYNPFNSKTYQDLKAMTNLLSQVPGVALDYLSAETRNGLESTVGKYYYGKSDEDIARIQKEQYQKVLMNFLMGTSGSEIMKQAKKNFEAVEEGSSKYVEDFVKDLAGGEGWSSWGANKLTNFLVSTLTTFGKGTSVLADSQSSGIDKAGAIFDIGLTMIGGSKSFVKGSSVVSNTVEAGAGFAEKTLNWFAKKLTGGKIAYYESQLARAEAILAKEGISKAEREAAKALRKKMKGWIGNLVGDERAFQKNIDELGSAIKKTLGGAAPREVIEGAKQEIGTSLTNILKRSFEHGLSGYWDALKTMYGTDAVDFVNTFVGSLIDGKISDLVKGILNNTSMPWNIIVCDGSYRGDWPIQGGKSFPVDGTIDGNLFTASGSYAMTYYGVAISTKFTLNGSVDAEGKMSGTISGGGSIKGQIKGQSSGGGSFTGTCDGETVRLDYSVSGSTSISGAGTYGGGQNGVLTLTRI